MMNLAPRVAILLLSFVSCLGQTGKTGGSAAASSPKLETMPQSLEVRFALSASPPHLRDGATAYVLDPAAGYIVNRKGTNGFSCIVMRTEWAWPQLPFRDDIYVPIGYDEEGSKKMLPVWMDVAQMRARGLNPKQIYNETMKKFDNGTYQKPARAGISYMTGPLMRSYPAPDAIEVMTMALPHYMFYAPNVKNADVGGKPGSAYPFILPQGPGPHDVIILLVGETEKAKRVEAGDHPGFLAIFVAGGEDRSLRRGKTVGGKDHSGIPAGSPLALANGTKKRKAGNGGEKSG